MNPCKKCGSQPSLESPAQWELLFVCRNACGTSAKRGATTERNARRGWNTANQPSHRPLREGEMIQDEDEFQTDDPNVWEPVPRCWFGSKYSHIFAPMRRPVRD